MIIPGHNEGTLAEQTCSHFPTWLDELVASKDKSLVVWIFRHDLGIGSLASWFAYCEAGENLLRNLTGMPKDDDLVRIGFCFLLLITLTRRPGYLDTDRPQDG